MNLSELFGLDNCNFERVALQARVGRLIAENAKLQRENAELLRQRDALLKKKQS